MNKIIGNIFSSLSGFIGVICWFLPSINIYFKSAIFLFSVIIFISSYYIKLYIKYKQLKVKFEDTSCNHAALGVQFKENSRIIDNYGEFIQNLNIAFLISLSQDPEIKIKYLYDCFIMMQKKLN